MRPDIIVILVIFALGAAAGVAVTVSSSIVKDCIYVRIIAGTYSPVGTFFKLLLFNAAVLTIVCFLGFFRYYRFVQHIVIFYLGYRAGADIAAVSTVFLGVMSGLFIYAPYYLFTLCIYTSIMLYVRILLPGPRNLWWCYCNPIFWRLIRRLSYLIVIYSIINIIIYIINPAIFGILVIVI